KEGAEYPSLINAVKRSKGDSFQILVSVFKVKNRNEYEDALILARRVAEETTQAKDRFLAHVSHELRTPLTAILGWAELLKIGEVDEQTKQLAYESIEESALSQSRMV